MHLAAGGCRLAETAQTLKENRVGRSLAAMAAGIVSITLGLPAGQPAATVAHGGFTFPDTSGTRVMLLGAVSRMNPPEPEFRDLLGATSTIRTAFCASGATRPVAYIGHQAGDGAGNGRQYHWQFEHLDGLVFGVRDGKALQENETCFLATDAFTRSITRLAIDPASRPGTDPFTAPRACDGQLAARIAGSRQRSVANCWPLAQTSGSNRVSLVLAEFAREGSAALASLVAVDGGRLVFADEPGDYSREGGLSAWRVSDGGVLDPRLQRVVFIARRGDAIVLAMEWIGEEGVVLTLFESSSDRFREILRESWYRMPI